VQSLNQIKFMLFKTISIQKRDSEKENPFFVCNSQIKVNL
jgi:hypothetical protein